MDQRSYIFQELRKKIYACLVANYQQKTKHLQWPQSKLCLPVVIGNVSNATGYQWTALPRPNTEYLTRQPLFHHTLEDLLNSNVESYSPESPCEGNSPEEDPFAKFDELCANVDLTVYTNSSSEENFPIIDVSTTSCSNSPSLTTHNYTILDPKTSSVSTSLSTCPVCGHLLMSKALLEEHMKTCVDIIDLD